MASFPRMKPLQTFEMSAYEDEYVFYTRTFFAFSGVESTKMCLIAGQESAIHAHSKYCEFSSCK